MDGMTLAALSTYPPLFDWQQGIFHQHAGQYRAWTAPQRFVIVVAGSQGGKTEWGIHWLAREIQTKGPGDYYAVTSTYPLFEAKFKPVILDFFRRLPNWHWAEGDGIMSHPGGYRLLLRSAGAVSALEAGTAKAAWLDECGMDEFPQQAEEAIERRLAIHQGRILFTSTPYNVVGWFKSKVDLAKGGDPDYALIQFRSIDNPVYPVEEYERLRRTLPDWKFQMFCNGRFTRPAGLIYGDYRDEYAPTGHLVRPFPIPKEWLRYVGIDFGGTEHLALIWLARDPETDCYYAYREELGGGHTGPERAREALEYGEPVQLWVGGAQSEDQQRLAWATAGVGVAKPLFWEVESGIDRVIGLFKERRLFVFDSLSRLRMELGTYSRELDAVGEPLIKIAEKEKFHVLDSIRYIASHLPLQQMPDKKPIVIAPTSRRIGDLRALMERDRQEDAAYHGEGREEYL